MPNVITTPMIIHNVTTLQRDQFTKWVMIKVGTLRRESHAFSMNLTYVDGMDEWMMISIDFEKVFPA